MTALSLEEVERIAQLAHLELTAEEKTLFARQLAEILTYAEQVQQLDTTGVPATAHVHPGLRAEREDTMRPSLSVSEALANAPDPSPETGSVAGLFRVPRVIGG